MRCFNLSRLLTAAAVYYTNRLHATRDRYRAARDEGSELVAMAILAGTLAGLAYLLYVVLKGKAMSWVHKIPGPGSK